MDKINRALSGVEDNAARIDSICALVKSRTHSTVAVGKTVGAYTSFGSFTVSGGAAVIVAFDGGGCDLMLGDDKIASGASPMLAAPSRGSGELRLSSARSNARALIIGAVADKT